MAFYILTVGPAGIPPLWLAHLTKCAQAPDRVALHPFACTAPDWAYACRATILTSCQKTRRALALCHHDDGALTPTARWCLGFYYLGSPYHQLPLDTALTMSWAFAAVATWLGDCGQPCVAVSLLRVLCVPLDFTELGFAHVHLSLPAGQSINASCQCDFRSH
jgi:hypothetical protein